MVSPMARCLGRGRSYETTQTSITQLLFPRHSSRSCIWNVFVDASSTAAEVTFFTGVVFKKDGERGRVVSLKWCRELSAGSRSSTTTDRYVLAIALFSGDFFSNLFKSHIFRLCGDTNLFCTRSRRDLFYVRYVGAAVVPYRVEPGVHLMGRCRWTGKSARFMASCPVL